VRLPHHPISDISLTLPAFIPGTLKYSASPVNTTGFTMFLEFPAEIRNMVWELAATNHRHDPSRLVFLFNCSKIECPALLLVNREATGEAAKYFQKLRKFKPVREGKSFFFLAYCSLFGNVPPVLRTFYSRNCI
jgi:hypothetical protein